MTIMNTLSKCLDGILNNASFKDNIQRNIFLKTVCNDSFYNTLTEVWNACYNIKWEQ